MNPKVSVTHSMDRTQDISFHCWIWFRPYQKNQFKSPFSLWLNWDSFAKINPILNSNEVCSSVTLISTNHHFQNATISVSRFSKSHKVTSVMGFWEPLQRNLGLQPVLVSLVFSDESCTNHNTIQYPHTINQNPRNGIYQSKLSINAMKAKTKKGKKRCQLLRLPLNQSKTVQNPDNIFSPFFFIALLLFIPKLYPTPLESSFPLPFIWH